MSTRLIRLRAPDRLESALVAAADLDRAQLEQLRAHVAALLEALPALPLRSPVRRRSTVSRARPVPPEGVQCGPRGGGFIEWKHIRHGAKLYGPYPYWRVRLGRRQCSIYLRGLAQATRAAVSTG
jgi:hypothetical protein